MSWSFSVAQPADPGPCHDAAATLRAVADAADDATRFLGGEAAVSPEVFGGVAAERYRAASAALGTGTAGVAADTRVLAEALDTYASRIAAVRRTLERVRAEAVRAGIEVTPDDLVQQVPIPGTEQDATFHRLEASAADARADAESAYLDWRRALDEHTTTPLPVVPSGPPGPSPVPCDAAAPDPEPRDPQPRDRRPLAPVGPGPAPGPSTPEPASVPAHPHPDEPTHGAPARRRTAHDREVGLAGAPRPVGWRPAAYLTATDGGDR